MAKLKTVLGAAIVAASVLTMTGIQQTSAHETTAMSVAQVLTGAASWYGPKFHGRLTANGERFDMDGLTAAHKTLPFGTRVRVTNPANGKAVVVRINDRGPYSGKRVLDLSREAARAIGLIKRGVGKVKIEVLQSA